MKKHFKWLPVLVAGMPVRGASALQTTTSSPTAPKRGGEVLNTDAIQRLIDRASAEGGGRVIVPEGTFLTGGLQLKSNVDHLRVITYRRW